MTTTPPPPSLAELRRQIAEIDTLAAQGVLTGEAARARRDELERAVLDAVGRGARDATAAGNGSAARRAARPSRALVAGIAVFVLAVGALGYAWRGNREALGVGPGAASATAAAPHGEADAQIDAMIAQLAERMKTRPDDAEGWSMLARSYTVRGRHAEALAAYRRVVELRPKDAQALADYADGLASSQGSLDGEPGKLVAQALALDPRNVKALALAGTIAYNRADYAAAAAHWQRAIDAGDPSQDFMRQLRDALADAQRRAGLPVTDAAPAAADAAPAANKAGDAPAATAANANAVVAGRITLADSLRAQAAPDDTVFVFARSAAGGSKMPLAILRKQVRDLPLDFVLDDSLAMSPQARLSSSPQLVVGARISKSGNAVPQSGDLQGTSAPVALGTRDLRIEIGEAVR
jgi:cytochrome c-type biogenesis protein CcmH